ncbi:MAG TPA: ABC transporter ATP-binding protein [Longimicrobiales bacterium]|nr:ABC transporter ATP-binding protein [Longimicrobiales bacterium]
MSAVFESLELGYRYPRAAIDAVRDVRVAIPAGSLYAVIGPNGCGKTTLLRLLLGALRPSVGSVRYAGRDVADWPRRDLALRIGVVPQVEELVFPLSVRELVAMGRYPHLGPWRSEGGEDRRAVDRALETCAVAALADRSFDTLSGGERQRVRVARALAQEPETLVLDEPTASLDIAHEMGIFALLRRLADGGVTVVLVTHNLNVAARFADRLLLMHRGRTAAEGDPVRVLARDVLEPVYDWPLAVAPHPGPGPDEGSPQILPLRKEPS